MPVLWTSQMIVNDGSKIIIDNSRMMLQIVASLTDNSRGVIYIYNRNMFIAKATRPNVTKK